jgi:ankyrin repeat protein
VDGDESDAQDGSTVLIWAAANGHTDCVRLLIDAGADKEARNHVRVGRCLLSSAAPFLPVLLSCFLLLCLTGIFNVS